MKMLRVPISLLITTIFCGCATRRDLEIDGFGQEQSRAENVAEGKAVIPMVDSSRNNNSAVLPIEKGMRVKELTKILGEPTEKGRFIFNGAIPVPEPEDAMWYDYEEIKKGEDQFLRVSVWDGTVESWYWIGPFRDKPEPDASNGGFDD